MSLVGKEGGCDCGAVRFRLEAEPIVVNCCHCRACQRQSGSAFAINVIVETDQVTILSGDPIRFAHETGSGAGQSNLRCDACGTSLASVYHAAGETLRFLRGGAFDDSTAVVPDVHIFTAEKVDWVAIPEGMRSYEGFYPGRDIPAIMGEGNAARFGKATGRG